MTRRLILVLLALPLAVGCKFKPLCFVEERVSQVATDVVVGSFACKNREAVYRDVGMSCNKMLGLCDRPQPMGPIADFVCPFLGNWAKTQAAAFAKKKLPGDWECEPDSPDADLGKFVDLLTVGCKALPF